jgi:Zinc knuckle
MDRFGRVGGRFGSGRGGPRQGRGPGRGFTSGRSENRESKPILNAPLGGNISPEKVQRWMVKLSTVVGLQCAKSGVSKIIKDDGTIGNYPVPEQPQIPGEANDPDRDMLKVDYSIKSKKYNDLIVAIEEDKRLMVNIIKDHLGEDSLARVRAKKDGRDAIDKDDPKKLLEVIYATHNNDDMKDNTHNVSTSERSFQMCRMEDSDSLLQYHDKYQARREAFRAALVANGENAQQRMPSEATQAISFINGLSGAYKGFKDSFIDGTNTEGYPATIEEAFRRAQRAQTVAPGYRRHYSDYRGVFAAGRGDMRGNGRGGRGHGNRDQGRGYGGGRGYNGRGNNWSHNGRGNQGRGYSQWNNNRIPNDNNSNEGGGIRCFICKEVGHIARDCPDRDDAVIDQALENNSVSSLGTRGGGN